MRRPSFQVALTIYAGLCLLAGFSLEGPLRTVVIVVLAGFAFKTWIGKLREQQEQNEDQPEKGAWTDAPHQKD